MKYVLCLLLVLFSSMAGYAEVKEYECISVNSENVYEPDLRRMKANIVVKDAYLVEKRDLIDTARAAALDLYKQSEMDVIVVKIFPTEDYAKYFPQVLDMTYAPNKIGWSGQPSATWVAFIADKMPTEKEMFKISTWIVEQAKNQKTLMDKKEGIAKQLKLPVDDVYFPIFTLVPCVMENEG